MIENCLAGSNGVERNCASVETERAYYDLLQRNDRTETNRFLIEIPFGKLIDAEI